MTEEKVIELLADMSLKEKIGQMMQLDVSCFNNEEAVTGTAADQGITEEDMLMTGSILGAVKAEEIKSLQKKCMERQPHHIPVVFMADIINGYKTIFPIPLGLGCTFSPETARTAGDIMARESAAEGLHVTFAPMADLVRDARWGRVMESTGEDPYLNARMAEAMVRGIQGEGEHYEEHLGACTKHFAAYGAPTAGKEYNNVELSERTLREDYFPAYEAAIKAGSAMVMTSFNTLDRIPATANQWLMRKVLREEMGFEGVLVSDYNAVGELINHGVAQNKQEAAKQAIEAGTDLDMMGGCYITELENLVKSGQISEELIDQAVLRILKLKNKLGLFENPYRGLDSQERAGAIFTQENRAKARKAAQESMVLLENRKGFLPLKKEEKVAFIGPYTEDKHILGAWSFFGDVDQAVTCRQGVEEKGANAAFEKGCGILNPGQTVYGFRYNMTNEDSEEETKALIKKAAEAAADSDKVVLLLGEAALQSGEGASRGDITIPDVQKRLLDAVIQANKNTAAVIFAGRPLDLREVKEKTKALLYAWMPGTEGGRAVADILYGDADPQGRLSMSMPWSVGQVPVFYGEFSTGRHVEDGEYMENRFLSRYSDIPNQPLYPFGYGLSYTEFTYSGIKLDKEEISMGEPLKVSVDVKNTGDRPGVETVQLYVRDKCGSVARPVRELKGFAKLALEPGESREAVFTLTSEDLKFYTRSMEYQAEPGEFIVWAGGDSRTSNGKTFRLLGNI